MSTGSGTLFGRVFFFTPLLNASKSFFFPIVKLRRAVVVRVAVVC
jgi:hypothetical protein